LFDSAEKPPLFDEAQKGLRELWKLSSTMPAIGRSQWRQYDLNPLKTGCFLKRGFFSRINIQQKKSSLRPGAERQVPTVAALSGGPIGEIRVKENCPAAAPHPHCNPWFNSLFLASYLFLAGSHLQKVLGSAQSDLLPMEL